MVSSVYAGFHARFGVCWSSNTQSAAFFLIYVYRFVYEIMFVQVETRN